MQRSLTFSMLILIVALGACSTVKKIPAVQKGSFVPAEVPADSVTAQIPVYDDTLLAVKGKGKAIVSEPDNSQRVTLYFSSNRQKSLITAKTSIGIEGGKLLTDGDSLLIYNKVDKFARIIAIKNNNLKRINRLASLNLLEILNYPVQTNQVENILADDTLFMLVLTSGAHIFVDKETYLIKQVNQPASSGLPYSTILYDGYDTIDNLKLPRRITIFSSDRSSKIDLLIQSLEINPELGELEIELPDDIKIYRQ